MRTTTLGSILTTGLVLTVVLTATERVRAQPPGGFGAQMWMDRLDSNQDGRLDPDELSQSRFPLADMAERAGVDASRGLSADDVEKVFENMRQQGGGFGPPGGFGGDRGGRSGDRGGRGGFDRGGSDRGGRNGDRGSQPKPPEPPPRVTVDLPATYAPGDSNGDGQLELSEWLRWKSRAALTEFLSLDRNHDGILTPRELAQADSPLPVDVAQRLPGADPAALQPFGGAFMSATPTANLTPPSNPTMSNPITPSPTTSNPMAAGSAPKTAAPLSGSPTPAEGAAFSASSPASAASPTEAAAERPTSSVAAPVSADVARHTATAHRFFKILDRDGDGKITDLEWQRSSRLRPRFEQAGADLSQPMAEEQFVTYYVKFSTGS